MTQHGNLISMTLEEAIGVFSAGFDHGQSHKGPGYTAYFKALGIDLSGKEEKGADSFLEWLEGRIKGLSESRDEYRRIDNRWMFEACQNEMQSLKEVREKFLSLSEEVGGEEDSVNPAVLCIRKTTERLIAEGPEACRKFLKDAGIIDDDSASPDPESSLNK